MAYKPRRPAIERAVKKAAQTEPIPAHEDEPEQSKGQYWHAEIDAAEKIFRKWQERAEKVVKRYRDDRDAVEHQKRKFNILWSNVQVLLPALYGRKPKPEVSRRFKDQDPVGRTAALMLERVIEYEVDQFPDFDASMRGAVEDRLLPGRGVAWIRYEPSFETIQIPTGQAEDMAAEGGKEGEQVTEDVEVLSSEHTPCDYVHWKDYLHSPARTWEEVWWVARKVYMTRDEGVKRFGEIFRNVPLTRDYAQDQDPKAKKNEYLTKKACVWEIWDKNTKRVCWIAKDYKQELDEQEDPLGLEEFFPCPKALYATTTTGSLIPVPDYCEYQDQADELDILTQRIAMLVKACKANGVYNAEFPAIKRLLQEGVDNTMIPVDSWAMFAEKGGTVGAMQMVEVESIIKVLAQLYESREACKQTIYEVGGIADVLRGATDAQETLGAQQLKAQFGSMRLKYSQNEVARFASDLFKLKAQVICKFYSPASIMEMSGVEGTPDAEHAPQAIELLKNAPIRDFRISVEADTLAQIDEMQDKQERIEFVTMLGAALKEAGPIVAGAPELAPVVFEAIKFAARGFKTGKTMEAVLERAQMALEQRMSQPQQDPSIEAEKIKAEATREKAQLDVGVAREKANIEREKMAAQRENDMAQIAIDGQRAQVEAQSAQQMAAIEIQKARLMPQPRGRQ